MEKSNIEKLKEYEKEGFVFHGSPNGDIEILEPRQATDDNQESGFNVDKAVFAAYSPVASTLFACMSLKPLPDDIGGAFSVNLNDDEVIVARIPLRWKPYVINNCGYVYVLPGNSFVGECEGGWQVKSKVVVEPVDVVKVSFDDFERLGGQIVWEI